MAKRMLKLDIFDYQNQHICPLYDSQSDISGQATDVMVTCERNGWKELSFKLPSMCEGLEGQEPNFRLQYLISEYKIRLVDEHETDWYIISENKITHEGLSKNITVRAGHISMLLKTRNLGLEFTDEQGNNVGTARELLTTILEGTDWHVGRVYTFLEKDMVLGEDAQWYYPEKRRSLIAPSKTGAFKLIQNMCELFDAKAIYHGEGMYEDGHTVKKGKTVDILPMNPFSENLAEGEIPDEVISGERKVIELHYDRNIKHITRTLDSENMITKLYAYGSYGDMNGLCSMQTCHHDEYTFYPDQDYPSGTEFRFQEDDGTYRFFTCTERIRETDELIYSRLDFASRSYIWNDRTKKAYHVYEFPQGNYETLSSSTMESVQNYFPAVYNFNYYHDIGLLTEDMFQQIATFQRTAYEDYVIAEKTAQLLTRKLSALSSLANSQTGVLRLAISGYETTESSEQEESNALKLIIDTSKGDNGILWRTDYNQSPKNYFSWCPTTGIKPNGDPLTKPATMLMILHDTDPVTWETVYLKQIDNRTRDAIDAEGNIYQKADNYVYRYSEGFPETISVWGALQGDGGTIPKFKRSDRFYLFASNSMSGSLGALQVELEAVLGQKITSATATSTEEHPFYFMDGRVVEDKNGNAKFVCKIPPLSVVGIPGQYGWYYRHYPDNKEYTGEIGEPFDDSLFEARKVGRLFFCGPQDTKWHPVFIGTEDNMPEDNVSNRDYFFDEEARRMYIRSRTEWVLMDTEEEKRMTRCFSQAYYYCRRYDQIHKGEYQKYIYTSPEVLPPDRYLLDTGYDNYWAFTTTQNIAAEAELILNTTEKRVYQDDNVAHVVSVQSIPKYTLTKASKNDLDRNLFTKFALNRNTGEPDYTRDGRSSPFIKVKFGHKYFTNVTNGYVLFFSGAKDYIGYKALKSNGAEDPETNFVVPVQNTEDYDSPNYVPDAQYLRITTYNETVPSGSYLRIHDYKTMYFMQDNAQIPYKLLKKGNGATFGPDPESPLLGLNNLNEKFAELIEEIYGEDGTVDTLTQAQNSITHKETALAETLGELLKEGYWQENSYVRGDEPKLYRDAMDNLEKIAKPNATYEIDFLDLYEEQTSMLTVADNFEMPSWDDLQITDAAHLVDPEIGVNCWAYFDKISKCYDQPWRTTIEINTNLSLLGQHSFTDVMTKIAEVAKDSSAKQTLYANAAAAHVTSNAFDVSKLSAQLGSILNYQYQQVQVDPYVYNPRERDEVDFSLIMPISDQRYPSSAQLAAETITGQINLSNTMLNASDSSWYTDARGRMIFEDSAGEWAMMLSGAGLGIASIKDEHGDWKFRTAITGRGINAEVITGGFICTDMLLAGSITTDKVSASFGQVLDISSNNALALYATIDGERPAGSLRTTDSVITIAAANVEQDLPAMINVYSGGVVNLKAAPVVQRYTSISNFPVTGQAGIGYFDNTTKKMYEWKGGQYIETESGTMNIEAASKLKINTDGELDITSGGLLYINGGAVKILGDSNVELGSGADMTIGANSELLIASNAHLTVASGGGVDILGGGAMNIKSNASLNLETGGNMLVGSGGAMTIASNGSIVIDSGSHFEVHASNFSIDANGNVVTKGQVYMLGGSKIGNSSNNSSVFSVIGENSRSAMYRDRSSLSSNTPGIYLGTDGISVGNATSHFRFSVTDGLDITMEGLAKTYVQLTDPSNSNTINKGDQWIKVDPDAINSPHDWQWLKTNIEWRDLTTNSIRWKTLVCGDAATYVWDGNKWVLVSDTSLIVRAYTDIQQTQDEIKLEAARAIGVEEVLSSSLSITASEIRTEVNNSISGLNTTISTTAEGINTRITNEVEGLETNIEETAEGIRADIENEVEGLNTTINTKAGELSASISAVDGRVTTVSADVSSLQTTVASLDSDTGTLKNKTQFLQTSGKISIGAFNYDQGSNPSTLAQVTFNSNGRIKLSSTSLDDGGIETSSISIKPNNITIKSSGTLKCAADKIILSATDNSDTLAQRLTITESSLTSKFRKEYTHVFVSLTEPPKTQTLTEDGVSYEYTLRKGDQWIKDDPGALSTRHDWQYFKTNTVTWNSVKANQWSTYVVGNADTYVYTGTAWKLILASDVITDSYTKITQNAERIRLEAVQRTAMGDELRSSFNQTATQISARVTGLDSKTKYIQTDGKITMGAFSYDSGGDPNAVARINLNSEGKIKLSATAFDELGDETTSSIYLSPTKIKINSGGSFVVASNNFSIDSSGNVTVKGVIEASGGRLGEWYLGSNFIADADTISEARVIIKSPQAGNIGNMDPVFIAGHTTGSTPQPSNSKVMIRANGESKFDCWYINSLGFFDDKDYASAFCGIMSPSTLRPTGVPNDIFFIKGVGGETVFNVDQTGSLHAGSIDIGSITIDGITINSLARAIDRFEFSSNNILTRVYLKDNSFLIIPESLGIRLGIPVPTT